jgi:hypothetical protein
MNAIQRKLDVKQAARLSAAVPPPGCLCQLL